MDLLRRMIERLQQIEPSFTDAVAIQLEEQLRTEFGGVEHRIYRRLPHDELTRAVRARFNGRNAGQVAHELGIHRSTVYRVLKRG